MSRKIFVKAVRKWGTQAGNSGSVSYKFIFTFNCCRINKWISNFLKQTVVMHRWENTLVMISCEISLFVTAANREVILLATYASLASLARR